MKVLLTGGAGFIGSNVVDAYIKAGHSLAIVDNLSTGKEQNINPKAKFYKADIRDPKILAEVFKKEKPDIVNHHAAQISVVHSVKDPVFDAQTNILGSINLIEAALKNNVKKFIYISSGGAMYGEPKTLPVSEDYPAEPLSPYGITKHTVEHYLKLYSLNFGLKYTVLRYANVYGPRQDPKGEAGVISIFTEQLLSNIRPTIFGDGNKTRDYIYVGDVVKANIAALTKGENDAFNIGTGIQTKDFEIFKAIRDALGNKIEPIFGQKRPGEIDHICLSIKKADEVLSWKPCVKLNDGIKETVSFIKNSNFTF